MSPENNETTEKHLVRLPLIIEDDLEVVIFDYTSEEIDIDGPIELDDEEEELAFNYVDGSEGIADREGRDGDYCTQDYYLYLLRNKTTHEVVSKGLFDETES